MKGGRGVKETVRKSLDLGHPEHPGIRRGEGTVLGVTVLKLHHFVPPSGR